MTLWHYYLEYCDFPRHYTVQSTSHMQVEGVLYRTHFEALLGILRSGLAARLVIYGIVWIEKYVCCKTCRSHEQLVMMVTCVLEEVHKECIGVQRAASPWRTLGISGLIRHFVQTWPNSECSHTVQFLAQFSDCRTMTFFLVGSVISSSSSSGLTCFGTVWPFLVLMCRKTLI